MRSAHSRWESPSSERTLLSLSRHLNCRTSAGLRLVLGFVGGLKGRARCLFTHCLTASIVFSSGQSPPSSQRRTVLSETPSSRARLRRLRGALCFTVSHVTCPAISFTSRARWSFGSFLLI